VAEMYAGELSTRDIQQAFTEIGGECLLSCSTVSELTESLWEEYQLFTADFGLDFCLEDSVASFRLRCSNRHISLCYLCCREIMPAGVWCGRWLERV